MCVCNFGKRPPGKLLLAPIWILTLRMYLALTQHCGCDCYHVLSCTLSSICVGFKVEPKERMESTFNEINTLWQVGCLEGA